MIEQTRNLVNAIETAQTVVTTTQSAVQGANTLTTTAQRVNALTEKLNLSNLQAPVILYQDARVTAVALPADAPGIPFVPPTSVSAPAREEVKVQVYGDLLPPPGPGSRYYIKPDGRVGRMVYDPPYTRETSFPRSKPPSNSFDIVDALPSPEVGKWSYKIAPNGGVVRGVYNPPYRRNFD